MFLGNYFTISCSAFWGRKKKERKKGRKEERKNWQFSKIPKYII